MKIGNLDSVLQSLRQLFQQEYDRGAYGVQQRVMDSIGSGSRTSPYRKSRGGKRNAPRGTARKLIHRVLMGQKAGATVPKIVAAARTPAEKSLSVSAIRVELYKGKKERRYRNSEGHWSLPALKAAKAK